MFNKEFEEFIEIQKLLDKTYDKELERMEGLNVWKIKEKKD